MSSIMISFFAVRAMYKTVENLLQTYLLSERDLKMSISLGSSKFI